MKNYKDYSYDELIKERNKLEKEYNEIETQSLKDVLTFNEFCEKVRPVKENLFFVYKYLRLKKDPVITYGKDWNGKVYTIEDFKKECGAGFLTDEDGTGFYATESAKSDIDIIPSDVEYNLVREDFPYVIWFNN